MQIRLLRADEVEVRVQSVKEKGFSLLLFKDARVDMSILDETFGVFGWQRKHELINGNLFCTVSIFDKQTGQWIDKQDVGTESNTEKQKGESSDSFKRACFNIGIGRELYTSPFIWIAGTDSKTNKFIVKEIGYNNNREINHLVIADSKGKERYRLGSKVSSKSQQEAPKNNVSTSTDEMKCSTCGIDIIQAVKTYSENHFGKALCRDCQDKERK